MTPEELTEKAREMRAEGASYSEIGQHLWPDLSKSAAKNKAYRLTHDVTAPEAKDNDESEAGFLDVEDRFEQVLKDFGVKDSRRIINYVSSFEGIFTDMRQLRQALTDQLVSPSKALSLTKHWASIERVNIPEDMAQESVEAPIPKQPQRWGVEDGRPVPDPDGEYSSFAQALKVAKMERQPTSAAGSERQPPEWMSDPLKFIETMERIGSSGKGDEVLKAAVADLQRNRDAKPPEWMTDPLKFIETVERIGGGGKGDEALKTEVAALTKTIDDLKDERTQEIMSAQHRQIVTLTDKLGELAEVVVDLKKAPVGRTEMDIIHEVASGGLEFLKTELPGMRRDLKEAIGGTMLPPARTPEQREERKGKYREAVKRDQEIETLGRKLFFGEGQPAAPPAMGSKISTP